jgi:hypothetical protein
MEEYSVVEALDLEPIKAKLIHRKAGKGWTRQRADAAEREYRRFLYMVKIYPDLPIVPSADVEACWHQHIFDTRKYAADCQRAFGYFLHHFPYIGLRGNEDKEALERIRTRTEAIYEQVFGEICPSVVPQSGQQQRKAFSAALTLTTAYRALQGSSASPVRACPRTATVAHAGGLEASATAASACCVARPRHPAMPDTPQAECRAGFYLERPRPT